MKDSLSLTLISEIKSKWEQGKSKRGYVTYIVLKDITFDEVWGKFESS